MEKKKLLFCTHNPSKAKHVARAIKEYDVELLTLEDIGLENIDAPEDGDTFSEVAKNKFNYYAEHIDDPDLVLFVDDSGLSIDALNGEPGVKSRRWKDGQTEMTDQEAVEYLQERMKDVPQGQRSARFTSVIAYGKKDQRPSIVSGEVRGIILVEPRMHYVTPGYPYRAFFYVDGEDAMLSDLEKNPEWDTHRDLAIKKMAVELNL
ncbi:MAG: non-canonical purine NTP pyrophosphatase [Candidatus Saccharimonadales bacterium]|nr:non-canonical purine NTP pyrophosphatase [Candidatus Saccharimonadales bacterium]